MNEKVPKALTKKVEKPPHTPHLCRIFVFEHELIIKSRDIPRVCPQSTPPHTPHLRRIFLFEHELPRMTMNFSTFAARLRGAATHKQKHNENICLNRINLLPSL